MSFRITRYLPLAFAVVFGGGIATAVEFQYKSDDIAIAPARADEPLRESFSLDAAVDYVEKGTTAWQNARQCISCHTNGAYNQFRPALSPMLGTPPKRHWEFLKQELIESKTLDRETALEGLRPTQAAVLAHGMAEWDYHVEGKLRDETRDALRIMLSLQREDGSWGNDDCWPPLESSNYHGATVAALALATAPDFVSVASAEERVGIEKLRRYLREETPPHDYARLLLLWVSSRMEGLVDPAQRETLIAMALKHQQDDGGWSIRSFSAPESWGDGGRAERLRREADFENPPSDGHQTGLVLLVLREAGLPSSHPALQRGVTWLKANQRVSGRWWTESLNTDKYHYITYSGTLYPLAALYACDAL